MDKCRGISEFLGSGYPAYFNVDYSVSRIVLSLYQSACQFGAYSVVQCIFTGCVLVNFDRFYGLWCRLNAIGLPVSAVHDLSLIHI